MSIPDDMGSNASRGNIYVGYRRVLVLYFASIVCIEGQYLVGSEYCFPFLFLPSYDNDLFTLMETFIDMIFDIMTIIKHPLLF